MKLVRWAATNRDTRLTLPARVLPYWLVPPRPRLPLSEEPSCRHCARGQNATARVGRRCVRVRAAACGGRRTISTVESPR